MKEVLIVASRGRWENERWTQKYECNTEGTTNTLTGVLKDNLVLEIYDNTTKSDWEQTSECIHR